MPSAGIFQKRRCPSCALLNVLVDIEYNRYGMSHESGSSRTVAFFGVIASIVQPEHPKATEDHRDLFSKFPAKETRLVIVTSGIGTRVGFSKFYILQHEL